MNQLTKPITPTRVTHPTAYHRGGTWTQGGTALAKGHWTHL